MRKIQSKSYSNLSKFAARAYDFNKHIDSIYNDIGQIYNYLMGQRDENTSLSARGLQSAVVGIADISKGKTITRRDLELHRSELQNVKEHIQKTNYTTGRLVSLVENQHKNFDPKTLQRRLSPTQLINYSLNAANGRLRFIQEKLSDPSVTSGGAIGVRMSREDALRIYADGYESIVEGLEELKGNWAEFTAAMKAKGFDIQE